MARIVKFESKHTASIISSENGILSDLPSAVIVILRFDFEMLYVLLLTGSVTLNCEAQMFVPVSREMRTVAVSNREIQIFINDVGFDTKDFISSTSETYLYILYTVF